MLQKKILKKIWVPLTAVTLSLGAMFHSSCNFLDIDPYITDLFTLDTVFAKQEYVQKYLNNIYSYVVDYGSFRGNPGKGNVTMPWTPIADECVSGYKRGNYHNYAVWSNGELTPENYYYFDRWAKFYEGIRRANTFLMRVDECQDAAPIKVQEWKGEANFVKALCYFELMLTYGPVPIVPEIPQDFDTAIDELLPERSPWDECSEYVENLLRTAINLLPETRIDNTEVGKATKNAARAVLSRLTLYTASPLFNGQNGEFANWKNATGTPYLNPEKSMEKWAKAAATAKELVTLKPNDLYTVPVMDNTPDVPVPAVEKADFPNGTGGIDHFHSYKDMFDGECVQASANIELLFTKQGSDVTEYGRYMDPGMIEGWSGFYFPQRIVDAYYMADGRDINNASPMYPYENEGYTSRDSTWSGERMKNGFTLLAGTRNWYANREIRFYATVAFHNSFYPSVSTPPDKIQSDGKVAKYFANSVSGKEAAAQRNATQGEEYPMTGYLCRKFNHYGDSWITNGTRKAKYGVLYRMAEVYLNYVEAMNELDGSYTIGDITVSRDQAEMKRCFNLIRYRVGLPGITDADVADPVKMRELIERERLLEMMWEGRRYFDTRRNKKAIVYENEPVMGLDVSAKASETDKFFTIIKAKERNYLYKVFTTRQTFWPIPKHEIDKNRNLDQMIGY
ncbi:MAG: RagB/SusD family nutrient uptake outer membrane protein [Bacteroidales bacterium]|nr:RagB/SusD family nutrient uptake outer membrane protein [Bacteroidales bacterium]